MLPDLGVTHALLLQGPAGPFMRRFAEELEDHGIRATKVNFHAGDVYFFPGPKAVSYRGTFDEWPAFVEQLMEDLGADGVFVFGDMRPLHRMAIDVAKKRGAKVWVFEEGYLRPEWITLEEHGVNGNSRMTRDPDFYRALELPEPAPPLPIGARFHLMSWYSTFNALAFTHLNEGFPGYRHHLDLNAWHNTYYWVRNVARKRILEARETDVMPRLTGELSKRFVFVPLQVHNDYQLKHSPYASLLDFVREIAERFAKSAPPSDAIVFKHHPMDRAYIDYTDYFKELARALDLRDRLIYCHDQHLPTVLKHAKSCITINSTVGMQSIFHGTPVKTMGTAIYDMPGLTFQGTVEDLFAEQPPPDTALYQRFARYLLHTNQANGSFYKRVLPVDRGTGIRWFPL